MAKHFNYVLRDKVLNFIEQEFMQKGKFSISLTDLAVRVGEKPSSTQKLMDIVGALERSCRIKITKGKGNKKNCYEFITK